MSGNPAGTSTRPGNAPEQRSLRESRLPTRPRSVLEAVLARTSAILEEGLVNALNDFDQQLFRLAEQARSNEAQQRCFEALRELRRGRTDVTPRFLIAFESRLANLRDGAGKGKRTQATLAADGMSLVDEAEFEQSLALQEIASKAEIRHSQALFMLGRRFAVLAGTPAFEPDDLAVGPLALADCLRVASADLDLATEFRVQLYRSYDRQAMPLLHRLYEQINATCVELRILPNLVLSPPRVAAKPALAATPPGRASEGPRPAQAPVSAQAQGAGPGSAPPSAVPGQSSLPPGAFGWGNDAPLAAPGAGAATSGFASQASAPGMDQASPASAPGSGTGGRFGSSPGASIPSPPAQDGGFGAGDGGAAAMPQSPGSRRTGALDPALASIPGAAGLANPMTGWPVIQPVGSAPAPTGGRDADGSETVESTNFDTMRRLLAGRRSVMGQTSGPAPDATHPVSTRDVQSVLAELQTRPAPPLHVGGRVVGRSVTHLKQDLLAQLRQLSPQDKTPRLDDADNDTIDLVGMLFDHLGRDLKPASSVQDLIGRLQVPLLRVALDDKTFFTRRNHPARQLLNAITEAGLFWFDDTGEDRQIVDKMRVVVDRIGNEYDGDVGVFEEMLGDLARHLQTIARKSEVSERRHVDAAKGREKLELARADASREIAGRIGRRNPSALIRTLLEQAWTDVLALTLLRQGEDSDSYRHRLDVADRLISLAEAGGGTGSAADRALQLEVEGGLSQVGYHGEDVRSVVRRLFNLVDETAGDEEPTATELAIRLKARSRLGSETEGESRAAAPHDGAPPLTTEEQHVLARLRTIPFGTWFDFTINQQGEKARRKLAWFSPMTGRCLFVNQRGARVDERSMDQLARMIVKGQARVVEAQRESLIDRAWSAIVGTLKQFTGARQTMAGSEA